MSFVDDMLKEAREILDELEKFEQGNEPKNKDTGDKDIPDKKFGYEQLSHDEKCMEMSCAMVLTKEIGNLADAFDQAVKAVEEINKQFDRSMSAERILNSLINDVLLVNKNNISITIKVK